MVDVVYLDRDGTLNEDVGYLSDPGRLRILEGVLSGLRMLSDAGIDLAIISNQSGIGRGYFDERILELVHCRLREELEIAGIHLSDVEYCPHKPEDGCSCRKPGIGMIEAIERRRGKRCGVVVGDKESDILCGKTAGLKTVLVLTGEGRVTNEQGSKADFVAEDLAAAARWIVALT